MIKELVDLLDIDEKVKTVLRTITEEIEFLKHRQITRDEFNEMKDEIAHRMLELIRTVDLLAKAQTRTEERLEQLSQAQARTEETLKQLSQAQARTEETLKQLAQAQARTEERLEQLAEAQSKTEEQIRRLTERFEDMSDQLGGISHTIGYQLEDAALERLPALLKRDLHLDFPALGRKWIQHRKKTFKEKYEEVNIYGQCVHEGKQYYLVGESKSQLGKRDVESFLKKVERIRVELDGGIVPLMVSFSIHPEAEEVLNKEKISYYLSYELR